MAEHGVGIVKLDIGFVQLSTGTQLFHQARFGWFRISSRASVGEHQNISFRPQWAGRTQNQIARQRNHHSANECHSDFGKAVRVNGMTSIFASLESPVGGPELITGRPKIQRPTHLQTYKVSGLAPAKQYYWKIATKARRIGV
jgi:hypothetical protein